MKMKFGFGEVGDEGFDVHLISL